MMRTVALLLVATLALAGCSEADDPVPRPSSTTSPTPTPTPTLPPRAPVTSLDLLIDFHMEGCAGVQVSQATDMAAVQALLPDGYTAAPFAIDGVETGQALLSVDLVQCGSFRTSAVDIPDLWSGHVYAVIEAPETVAGQQAPVADSHEYLLQMLASPDVLSTLWPTAGYDTHIGNASLADATGVGTWQASLGGYQWSVLAPQFSAAEDGEASFARYTQLANGDVLQWTGNHTFPGTRLGPGSLDVPPGSPFAGLGRTAPDTLDGFGFLYQGSAFTDQDLKRLLLEPR